MNMTNKKLMEMIAEQLARIIELEEYIDAADKIFAQDGEPEPKKRVKR